MATIEKRIVQETHMVGKPKQATRLQEYGVGIFKTITSKSALKKAIKKKYIYVDGKIASTATLIKGEEIITLQKPIEQQRKREFVLPLEVIFEDDHLGVINKPAGVLVSGNAFKTIANALAQNLMKSKEADAVDPKPVHRLDFSTTGLLLAGKTATSITALNALFENKKISKTYYAVTIGEMSKDGKINFPIDGKQAYSNFEKVETMVSKKFKFLNLVKLKPETGRRHQLRKHLAALGNPILGDPDYGIDGLILKGKGLYLHAFSLEFVHPIHKKKMYFEKELPKKFNKLFRLDSITG